MLSEQGRTRGEGSDTQGGRACVLKGSREPRVEGRRKTKGRLDVLPLPPASSGYFCLPETFLLFKKPIIMDHKRKAVLRLTLCGSVYTGVLRAGTCWLLHALTPTRAHSQPGHPCPPPGALGGSWCLQCSGRPWVPASGATDGSRRWGVWVQDCPDKARGIPRLAPSQPKLRFSCFD